MKNNPLRLFRINLLPPALRPGQVAATRAIHQKRVICKRIAFFPPIAGLALFLMPAANASVTITFPDGSVFDGGAVGASQALTDGTTTFNISTVDIIGSDGTSNVGNGATHSTNIFDTLGLGINTSSVSGSESQNIDVTEAWIFKFNNDVDFESILITSFTSGQVVNLTFLDGSNSGAGTNYSISASDSAINYSYTADTPIRFRLDGLGTTADGNVRIVSFTVAAVPEPSIPLVFGTLLITAAAFSRRR